MSTTWSSMKQRGILGKPLISHDKVSFVAGFNTPGVFNFVTDRFPVSIEVHSRNYHRMIHSRILTLQTISLRQSQLDVKGSLQECYLSYLKIYQVVTSYSNKSMSMIPAVRSANLPTSQPKNTGRPALIIWDICLIDNRDNGVNLP